MGTYNERLVGRGKDRQAAQRAAWDDYVFENGHRCSFRGVTKAQLRRTVPPMHTVSEIKGRHEYISSQPNPDAPARDWLEEWEFWVDVHS